MDRKRRFGNSADPYSAAFPHGARWTLVWDQRAVPPLSSGGWAVHDVADAGLLWAFCCVVDTLSGQCLRRGPHANPLVGAVFEFSRPCVNAVQLHVNDARPLLPLGFWQSASDSRRSARQRAPCGGAIGSRASGCSAFTARRGRHGWLAAPRIGSARYSVGWSAFSRL